ncbi:MAG: hypothetical protein WC312_03830 [Candidatus Omnitrophota bacterium]|jgi:hypothetical protein
MQINAFDKYINADFSSAGNINAPAASTQAGSAGMGTVASGVISGLSDIATGFINASRIRNTYKFNTKMAELQADFNARMAQLQGRMVRLAADVEIKNIRQKAESLYSEQRAGYAKAGVKMTGSPAQVMMDSLREAELDVIYTDISATYNVGLTETQAGIYRTQAQVQGAIYGMQGKSAQYDALQNALKSILNMGVKKYARG